MTMHMQLLPSVHVRLGLLKHGITCVLKSHAHYPGTSNAWHPLNIGTPPGLANNPVQMDVTASVNSVRLLGNGVPNIIVGTGVLRQPLQGHQSLERRSRESELTNHREAHTSPLRKLQQSYYRSCGCTRPCSRAVGDLAHLISEAAAARAFLTCMHAFFFHWTSGSVVAGRLHRSWEEVDS